MKVHLVSGFLGSGKTTAIHQACMSAQKKGMKPAIVTNDQGMLLVDSFYFQQKGFDVAQVSNGCYCCNYNKLDESLQSLITSVSPDIIFAEAVGSCTDIVATVMKPLQRSMPDIVITVSTFVDARLLILIIKNNSSLFNEDVRYIFFKQLEEAEAIVVNKTDLVSKEEKEIITCYLDHRYTRQKIIFQSNFSGEGILEWYTYIEGSSVSGWPDSLQIDYEKYAAGEARLAWLDKQLTIKSSSANAEAIAVDLIQKITRKTIAAGYFVGHMKYWLNDRLKISVTAGTEMEMPDIKTTHSESVNLLINARVETAPEKLVEIIDAAISEIKLEKACETGESFTSAFQLGYPIPVYRI